MFCFEMVAKFPMMNDELKCKEFQINDDYAADSAHIKQHFSAVAVVAILLAHSMLQNKNENGKNVASNQRKQ